MMDEAVWRRGVTATVLILGPFVFAFAFALDIYVPSVPEIQAFFHTSQDVIQLTLSLFLFFLAIGQLAVGPISDAVGRKKVAFASAVLFTVGCLIAVLAFNVWVLIAARIVQALGACGMMVSAFAIVRDTFSGNQSAKVYSYLNAMISLSPLMAPIVGGYIAHWVNWRWSFVLLIVIGSAAVLLVYGAFHESLPVNRRSPVTRQLARQYLGILKDKRFLLFGLCAGTGNASFFAFFSSSPFVLINLLHVPEQHFGFYFGMLGVVYMIGSLLGGKLVTRLGIMPLVVSGCVMLLVSGIWMWLWYRVFGLDILGFILPISLTGIGGAFMMGASTAGALEPFGHIAGMASALIGCLQFGYSAIVGTVLMLWPVESTVPLSVCYILLSVSCLTALLGFGLSTRLQKSS